MAIGDQCFTVEGSAHSLKPWELEALVARQATRQAKGCFRMGGFRDAFNISRLDSPS